MTPESSAGLAGCWACVQVSQLPNLERLALRRPHYSARSMGSLSRLSSLTCLNIYGGQHLPSSLAAMTWLERLLLGDWNAPLPARKLYTCLRQLRQLTCLQLVGKGISQVPASLTGLSQLQLFMALPHTASSVQQKQLPGGCWLSSVRRLCAPWPILCNSTAVLAQAQQLEHLAIAGLPACGEATDQAWRDLWDWAAAHPPLQRLSFDLTDDSQPFNLEGPAFDEVAGLLRRRLGLSVFRAGCGSDQPSFEEEYEM
jgi:hypothetical protein